MGWTLELTILRRKVASGHCRWIRTGRIGASEEFLMSHRLFRTIFSHDRAVPWRHLRGGDNCV